MQIHDDLALGRALRAALSRLDGEALAALVIAGEAPGAHALQSAAATALRALEGEVSAARRIAQHAEDAE